MLARSQTRDPFELTFGELREQVARARAGLQRLGVGRGDRVVAYLPNIPETLVAFLATASLGAIWSTLRARVRRRAASIDRFGQIEPKVLLAVDGYRYGDKDVDRREQVAAVRAGLPSLEHVVHVPYAAAPAMPSAARSAGTSSSPSRGPLDVRAASRSTTRSTCCSPRARPGCRRRSSTATAASCSSTCKNLGLLLRPRAAATGCSGSRRPAG